MDALLKKSLLLCKSLNYLVKLLASNLLMNLTNFLSECSLTRLEQLQSMVSGLCPHVGSELDFVFERPFTAFSICSIAALDRRIISLLRKRSFATG